MARISERLVELQEKNKAYREFGGPIPPITEELLDHLRSIFKPTLQNDISLRDVDRMLGQLQVIEHLAHILESQKQSEQLRENNVR